MITGEGKTKSDRKRRGRSRGGEKGKEKEPQGRKERKEGRTGRGKKEKETKEYQVGYLAHAITIWKPSHSSRGNCGSVDIKLL